MESRSVFLCSPLRTAIGAFQGSLSNLTAPQLGASVIKAIVERNKLNPESVTEIILGCVLTGGVGQAPARQAGIAAGLPHVVQATTVNKVCSSGLKAVMLAAQAVALGEAEAMIAGGMESMSQAPYLMPSLRNGARLGNAAAEDSILRDGLWDPYKDYHMGNAAELCAKEFGLTRETQDAYALESYARANKAIAQGVFKDEIIPVEATRGRETATVDTDEEPGKVKPDKVPSLKPAFQKDGTVTAANASSINDGAAAMIVCSEEYAKQANLTPFARLVTTSTFAQAPEWFTTSPVGAVERLLKKSGLHLGAIDLFEINEAFSAVALACSRKLEIDPAKLNISGGAVALGHPIGASGARILTTLLHGLKRTEGRYGVASICNGGGEATGVLVERV